MAAEANDRETFKLHLILGEWRDFKIILQKRSLGDLLPRLLKPF